MSRPASAWIAAARHFGLSTLMVMLLGDVSAATDVGRYGDPLPPDAVARLGTIRLGHSSVIHHVTFSPDGKTLATEAGAIYLWDAATGQMTAVCGCWMKRRRRANPTGSGVPSFQRAGPFRPTANLYDLTMEGKPQPTELYPKNARAMTFSPDGKVVALALGTEIVLVERATGKEIRRLKGHTDHILDLAFSPDGKMLVSGSYDLTALVWQMR